MPERTDGTLLNAFRQAMTLRAELVASGASRAEADRAVAKILRVNWPVPDEDTWPHWALVPRCGQCDNYGWCSEPVTDRLGVQTTEARPCICVSGLRYRTPAAAPTDAYAKAGASKPKPKGFTRWTI